MTLHITRRYLSQKLLPVLAGSPPYDAYDCHSS